MPLIFLFLRIRNSIGFIGEENGDWENNLVISSSEKKFKNNFLLLFFLLYSLLLSPIITHISFATHYLYLQSLLSFIFLSLSNYYYHFSVQLLSQKPFPIN